MKSSELTDKIMQYETGELSDEESIGLFQHLVNTGLAWQLQGSYGRTAKILLDRGLISEPANKEDLLEDNKSKD